MKRFLACTAAALLSGAAISQGEELPPPATTPAPTSVFDGLDADHDGRIAQQEAQAHPTVAEHFATADADGDGALSKEEFDATFKSE